MSDPMIIASHEHGRTRVFDIEAESMTAEDVASALGGDGLNHDKIEVVDTGALSGMGLTRYLMEGYGVAEGDLSGDRATLDALEGKVALIPSSAFSGETRLSPSDDLRFVGVYGEAPPAPHEVMTPTSDATRPERELAPPPSSSGRRVAGLPLGVIIVGALLLAAIVVLLV